MVHETKLSRLLEPYRAKFSFPEVILIVMEEQPQHSKALLTKTLGFKYKSPQ
jgi:hypothetical protein